MPQKKRSHGKADTKHYTSTRKSMFKGRRKAIVRKSPNSPPNSYHFSRGFDSHAVVGTTAGLFAMNSDSKYQIINLRVKFSDLDGYTDFNALFSEYKVKNFGVELIPNFRDNKSNILNSTDAIINAQIPNYQIFEIPANYTDDDHDFAGMTGAQIDSFINQTQRKSSVLMPGAAHKYYISDPKCVKYEGGPDKDGGTASISMGPTYWLSTGAPTGGNLDERTVEHYGIRLLIRRVDGLDISNSVQSFAFRVQHQVNFMCRKVQ